MLNLRFEQVHFQGTIKDVNLLVSKDNGLDHYAEQKKVRNYTHTMWPTAALIPTFVMGCPAITKWGDYSTSNIPTVVLKDIWQMWEYLIYHNHPIL